MCSSDLFKGRKQGIQLLLLVQMFPAILAISAVYVIMERVYSFAPSIGLGTRAGLLLVYLGGAMGVNIWLLKGFVDSIPSELDEAANETMLCKEFKISNKELYQSECA